MAKGKRQGHSEEVENHLRSSLDYVIHHRLTKGDSVGLIEPLEFFNHLYGLYSYVTANKRNSSTLREGLNETGLAEAPKSFLLRYLDILFLEESIGAGLEQQPDAYIREEHAMWTSYQTDILAEWAKLDNPVYDLTGYDSSPTSVVRGYYSNPVGKEDLVRDLMADCVKQRLRAALQDRYNFNKVRQHLNSLPNNKARIAYLVERKTEYLQVDVISESRSKKFDQKCDMEIAKLEKLLSLEPQREQQSEAEPTTPNPEHTLARKVLVITYLLDYARIGKHVDDSNKIDFMHFLVGGNRDNVRKRLKAPYKDNRKAYLEDMRYIKDIFQKR